MTDPVSSAASAASAASTTTNTSSAAGQTQLDTTYNEFIQLLLTQLKNQDPTNPVDTSQFTQQLVSLSEVQQSVNTNSNLEKLISVSQGTQVNNAVNYIGKTVDAQGDQSMLTNGNAEFAYSLPTAASSATVTITNSTGQVVFSAAGSTNAGKNVVEWDGTTNDGQVAPDGVYSISVVAQDTTGADITPTTFTTGVVTSVNIVNGDAQLSLNGSDQLTVPIENVSSIRTSGAVAQAA